MSGVLTEVRFWAQVIGDAKRTVICSPDLESRCKGYVEARGLAGLITVQASPYVPDDRIFVVDEQAIGADMARNAPSLWERPPEPPVEANVLTNVYTPGTIRDMTKKHPFTVRQITSGFTGTTKFVVTKNPGGRRVSTWLHITRESAQAAADKLNIEAMVKDFDDDPRPYQERLTEAQAAYQAGRGSDK